MDIPLSIQLSLALLVSLYDLGLLWSRRRFIIGRFSALILALVVILWTGGAIAVAQSGASIISTDQAPISLLAGLVAIGFALNVFAPSYRSKTIKANPALSESAPPDDRPENLSE